MALLSTVLSALLRKGLLVGGVLLVLVLLLEGLLWKFAPAPPETEFQYNLTNNVEARGLSREVTFGIDTRSLRGISGARGRSKRCETVVLGGSFLYEPLQQAESTWWGELSSDLEMAYPEAAFPMAVTANAPGVTQTLGIAIRGGLKWARAYLDELKPDLVIAVFGVSEVLDIEQGYAVQKPSTTAIPRPTAGWKDRLTEMSQLVRRLRQSRQMRSSTYKERKAVLEAEDHFVRNDERQRKSFESMPFDGQPPIRVGAPNDPLQEYLESLKALKAIAEAAGARFMVLGEPSLHEAFLGSTEEEERTFRRPRWHRFPSQESGGGLGFRPDPAWVQQELDRYYVSAAAWCSSAKVPFLNLNNKEVLPKTLEQFFNDTTLTNAGSKHVASKVQPLLVPVVEKILAN